MADVSAVARLAANANDGEERARGRSAADAGDAGCGVATASGKSVGHVAGTASLAVDGSEKGQRGEKPVRQGCARREGSGLSRASQLHSAGWRDGRGGDDGYWRLDRCQGRLRAGAPGAATIRPRALRYCHEQREVW